jgi:hypothetical protein
MRNTDVEVDAIALRARPIHLLEPDSRALPNRVDERILWSLSTRFIGITQHCLPERPNPGDVQCINRDLQELD